MKKKEQEIAIELRKQKKTFDKIIKEMKEMGYSVSKGALHKWFKKDAELQL